MYNSISNIPIGSCKWVVARGLPNNNLGRALGCVEGCRMRRERRMPNVGAVAIVANERLQRVYRIII